MYRGSQFYALYSRLASSMKKPPVPPRASEGPFSEAAPECVEVAAEPETEEVLLELLEPPGPLEPLGLLDSSPLRILRATPVTLEPLASVTA